MWLDIWSNDKLQQYAVAQKEEFKYGCWTRQIEADPCRLQKKPCQIEAVVWTSARNSRQIKAEKVIIILFLCKK